MDMKELEKLENENKDSKYMVHNGYLGWGYGTPQHPLIISRDTAIKIFIDYEKRTGKDAVSEITNHTLDFIYAEAESELYYKTGGNRIIGLYDPTACVFKQESDKEKTYDFDI